MGHHLGTKSSLVPLIDRLNKYPIGLADSEKLREILSLLFAEKEAFVASRFPLQEATLDELVRRTRLNQAELLPILEGMADKGLVMDLPYNGTTYYLLLPALIGFFELTFMKDRTDLPLADIARLMTEYLHENPRQGMAWEFFGGRTPLTRSLVQEEQIPVSSTITTFESAREIIRGAGFGAVGTCFCRHKKVHLKEPCRKKAPVDGICISLGTAAQFMVRRGFAREKSVPELMELLDRAQALGLTHITDNIRQNPSFICNCCACCCELLAGVQSAFTEGIAKTPYLAVIDTGRCSGCGKCLDACNVGAITLAPGGGGRVAGGQEFAGHVDRQVCLGCGVCVPACPAGAVSLAERVPRPLPPAGRRDLYLRQLREKKRLAPYLIEDLGKRLRRLLKIGR